MRRYRIIGLVIGVCFFVNMTGYIFKQANKQVKILVKARKIERVKKLEDHPKIELLKDVIKFCTENMGFEKTRSYRKIYLNGEKPVAYNIVICPELSLESLEWNFPVVGSFSYIGFFEKKDAEEFASGYDENNYDTSMRPVHAYSLLGYYPQVLFESQLGYADHTFTDVIIHEKVHETVFIKDNLELSESLACFFAKHAQLEYLARKYGKDSKEYRSCIDYYDNADKIRQFRQDAYAKLKAVYDTQDSEEQKKRKKQKILEEIEREYEKMLKNIYGLERDVKLNNADISGWYTYDKYRDNLKRELGFFKGDAKAMLKHYKDKYN